MDGIVLVARLFTEEHLREAISNPLFMLVMDGYSTRIDGILAEETRFPLHFMGMTYFLTHHVRECHTLTIEDAIRKMTSMPARHFRLNRRGLVHKNYFADIVVFDYDKLDTVSTVQEPLAYVHGIEHVFVNGIPVIRNGEHTAARPGRNLLR